MANKNTAVFGIYGTQEAAERGVDQLLSSGFSNSDVSVLMPDNESTRAFAHEKHTKAPEGTTTGATTGGVVGGTLGLLAGIGALAIPGVGPLIAAGPIVATIAGVGAGGTVGGIVGALVGMGIPEYEAKRFEGAVKEGGVLVSVHCDYSDEITTAKRVFNQSGAHDIASTGEEGSGSHSRVRERESGVGEPVYAQQDRDRVLEENRDRRLAEDEREGRIVDEDTVTRNRTVIDKSNRSF